MVPKVSIITVYYNTPKDMLHLQRSMKQFLNEDDYEWIVADNNSEVDLADQLLDATYLRMPRNFGFAAASNKAAMKAQAANLFFVNPDCEFLDDCLPKLLAVMQTSAVAGPQVLNPDSSIQLSFGPFLGISSEARQKMLFRFEKTRPVQRWLSQKKDFRPDYVSGCALMIRTPVFRETGGFDENFFLYNEDVDLCKRVRDRSYSVQYVSSARILHKRNRSVRLVPDRVRVEYRKSQVYYYRKHHGSFQNFLLKLYLALTRKLPADIRVVENAVQPHRS